MRTVEFLDTQPSRADTAVNPFNQGKIAIARQLEKWGISAIEAGFPAASPDSFTAAGDR